MLQKELNPGYISVAERMCTIGGILLAIYKLGEKKDSRY
jgi:hypothetical protein